MLCKIFNTEEINAFYIIQQGGGCQKLVLLQSWTSVRMFEAGACCCKSIQSRDVRSHTSFFQGDTIFSASCGCFVS